MGKRFRTGAGRALTWFVLACLILAVATTGPHIGGALAEGADGGAWSVVAGHSGAPLHGVTAGAGRLVAVGYGGTVLTSADGGASWTRSAAETGIDLEDVAFGSGRFVAVGGEQTADGWRGAVLTSSDGMAWTAVATGLTARLYGVAYGPGGFMAVGQGGAIYRSGDGANWEPLSSPVEKDLRSVTYGDRLYLAVGAGGVIVGSTTGEYWVKHGLPTGIHFSAIRYLDGRYVAVGIGGGVITSTDGRFWKTVVLPGARPSLTDVARAGGLYVATDDSGNVQTSADLKRWQTAASGLAAQLNGLAQTAYGLVAVGADGTVAINARLADCGLLFADLAPADPACPAVAALTARGVVNGYGDGTFRPEQSVTRAEFAKLAVTALGGSPQPGGAAAFSDTSAHWAAQQGYLQAASAMKLIQGFPDGTFRPDAPVTRAEAAKMAAAAAGLQPGGAPAYADISPDTWYAGWVAAAQTGGLVGGAAPYAVWAAADFKGSLPATRAESAMLLANLIDR